MDVCIDSYNLIEQIQFYPKNDEILNTLFIASHDINDSQKRMYKAYFINYDWEQIFKQNPYVSL